MVGSHALDERLSRVILAVHEILSRDVVFSWDFGRVEGQMVGASAFRVDPTPFDSFPEGFLIDFELKHFVDVHLLRGEHLIKLFGLGYGPREAVKKDATFALGVAQVVLDQSDDELVGDELATLHDSVSLLAKLSSSSDGITEHVSCRQVANAEVVFDFGALGTLARTGWSNHNNIHGRAL